MGKLYPPIIESILPACYGTDKGMVKITIPFSMNRSVTASQVGGFELKIKTVQTGAFLYTFSTTNPTDFTMDENNSQVTFYIDDVNNKLKIGQFYKIQLAYIQLDAGVKSNYYSQYVKNEITLEQYEQLVLTEGVVGYYSTVGTIKYTTKPKLYINDFTANHLNDYVHSYTGYYDQTNGDTTEKVYSYRFDIYDKDNNLILSSEKCIHNSSMDTNPEISMDHFTILWDLKYYEIYYIQYTITSINGIVLSSPKYRIMQRETIDPELYFVKLEAKLNFDNGYIDCSLASTDLNNIIKATGSFVLSRADESSNYTNWVELKKFKLYLDNPLGFIFRDCTFEQGKKYRYSIQQYNDYGLYSKRLCSDIILGDFEDAFLYDGERQLKLRYNTKINKFSTVVQEAKQETIGSQYPFIFRNGNVNYHEFSVGGLISYTADEARLFLDESQLNLNYKISRTETKSLTTDFKDSLGEEITRERIFKNEVLDWLNNGKAKLFRSSEEGNFIIRLMKISLKPETKLGRMLHNFSGTAYEIAEYNTDNLFKFNFANNGEVDNYITQWKSIELKNKTPNQIIELTRPADSLITSLRFDNMKNGDQIQLTYKDRSKQIIQIGATGTYYLDNINLNIDAITILPRYRVVLKVSEYEFKLYNCYYILRSDGTYYKPLPEEYDAHQVYYAISNTPLYEKGLITYSYSFKQVNQFAHIKSIKYGDPSFKQFIGEHNILDELNNISTNKPNLKKKLTEIYSISVSKRPIDKVVVHELNEETLADSGQYYYGTLNNENQLRSERFPLIEMKYPIGLRAYEPAKYYVINKEDYVQDSKELKVIPIRETDVSGVWDANKVYYLKGRYVTPGQEMNAGKFPIGLRALEEHIYYIEDSSKEEGYRSATEDDWDFKTTYYTRNTTLKGVIYYTPVSYMTKYKAHIFEADKFYRKIKHQEKIKNQDNQPDWNVFEAYTPYRVFNPDVYENYATQSYILDERYNEYVEAYVTLNKNYVYKPYEFYLNIVNLNDENSNKYKISTSVEFNVNTYKMDSTVEGVECEGTVLKYYKMKTILPHILHEVGTEWQEVLEDNQYKVHQLNTKKYIDFYNNKKNYREYDPYIEINGERIYVDKTINFSTTQLNKMGNITELKSGNGVIVDIVYQMKEYIYNIENEMSEKTRYSKEETALEESLNRLLLDTTDENYINLMDESHNDYVKYYNNDNAHSLHYSYISLVNALEGKGVIRNE